MKLFRWLWCQIAGHRKFCLHPKDAGFNVFYVGGGAACARYITLNVCERCGGVYATVAVKEARTLAACAEIEASRQPDPAGLQRPSTRRPGGKQQGGN